MSDDLPFRAEPARVKRYVLRAARRPDEAEGSFQEAFEIFARKGDVASANRLREALAEGSD